MQRQMEGHRAARDGRSGLLWRALPVCALLALGVLLTCGAWPCWPAWLASSPGRPAAGQPCCTRLAGGPRPRRAALRPAAFPAVGLNLWGRLRLGFSCRDAAVHAPPRQPFFLPNTSRSFPVIRTPTCPAEWSNAYFLHIPKTAGSFVDNVMRVGLGSCGSSRGVGNWCHRFTLPQLVRPSNARRLAPCGRAAGRAGPTHERLLCVFAARALLAMHALPGGPAWQRQQRSDASCARAPAGVRGVLPRRGGRPGPPGSPGHTRCVSQCLQLHGQPPGWCRRAAVRAVKAAAQQFAAQAALLPPSARVQGGRSSNSQPHQLPPDPWCGRHRSMATVANAGREAHWLGTPGWLTAPTHILSHPLPRPALPPPWPPAGHHAVRRSAHA